MLQCVGVGAATSLRQESNTSTLHVDGSTRRTFTYAYLVLSTTTELSGAPLWLCFRGCEEAPENGNVSISWKTADTSRMHSVD